MEPVIKTAGADPVFTDRNFVVKGYGAPGGLFGGKTLELMEIEREQPKDDEVLIEVLYCGVSRSDIHHVSNRWKNTIYPCVPGHEITGKVIKTGAGVTKYKRGDMVGVGSIIDSCGHCEPCKKGEEQYCQGPQGATLTYNGYFKTDGRDSNTFGGYSTHLVVKEDFVLRIPADMDPAAAAPILCAGVTVYSALKRWNIKQGEHVGIAGIGGLGHIAIMMAKAMGAYVVAITTKEEKRRAALSLGADEVLVSENEAEMQSHEMRFDYILCTVPDSFDINPYICLLSWRGILVSVGLMGAYRQATDNMEVVRMGRSVAGSLSGGIAETQEALEFCVRHHILPQVQMINIQAINDAFERVKDGEVRFRYVIDMQSLK